MPLANYCRKCKAETPPQETCPYCGGKLAKTGRRLSFGVTRTPWKNWFCWNALLRAGLPVLLLCFLTVSAAELFAGGPDALALLWQGGFGTTMLGLLGGMLACFWLLLFLQGPEKVHYLLDKDGVSAYTYLPEDAGPLCYRARLIGGARLDALREDERQLPGLTLVRRIRLPWERVRRVRCWREGRVLLFFRPKYWQALAVDCPVQDFQEAEEWVRAKMKRVPKSTVLPREKAPKKKKKKAA